MSEMVTLGFIMTEGSLMAIFLICILLAARFVSVFFLAGLIPWLGMAIMIIGAVAR